LYDGWEDEGLGFGGGSLGGYVMPQFSVGVPHALGREQAMERLQRLIERVREEHGDRLSDMQGGWVGNVLNFSFRAMGMGVQGTMDVGESGVNVQGQLPLAAAFFRGKIEQTIRDQLSSVLR
jgi:hypothetical protein